MQLIAQHVHNFQVSGKTAADLALMTNTRQQLAANGRYGSSAAES